MKKTTVILVMLVCSTTFGGVYMVKSGDTLSGILFAKVPGRIYGGKGNLVKLLELNPHIKNSNLIRVGEKINLTGIFHVNQNRNKKKIEETPIVNDKKIVFRKNGKQQNQSLFFSLNLSSESLSAVELSSNSAEIATADLGYGVGLRWTHKWNEKFSFLFDASLSKSTFNVAADKTLSDASQTKMYAGVGLKYLQNKNHQYVLGAGLGESFLLTTKNLSTLEIEKIVIPSISVSGGHVLKEFKAGFSLNSFWRAGALLPSTQPDYNTELGHYWSIGAGSFYNRSGKTYNISLSYGQRFLETEDIEQTNKNIGVSAGVGFDF